jgi:hypothetical protein
MTNPKVLGLSMMTWGLIGDDKLEKTFFVTTRRYLTDFWFRELNGGLGSNTASQKQNAVLPE